MKETNELKLDMYTRMVRIRDFENATSRLYAEGHIPGFCHLYIGEEAVATGVCECLREDDYITSTHRGHGHIIAKGGDLKLMMAELFGRQTGYCHGKGGSMHIADRDKGILGANGIVGAGLCISCGAGLSIRQRKTDQVCVCFFGDGASNQGTFHESLNLASLWKLPVIFVCENNLYGISVSQEHHQAIKDISVRAVSYNMPGITVDGNDPDAVFEAASKAVERARHGEGPTLIECKTYRQHGHFEGDPAPYKPAEEQEAWLKRDPIPNYRQRLLEEGAASEETLVRIEKEVEEEILKAIEFADAQPWPDPSTVVDDVYSDITEEVRVR